MCVCFLDGFAKEQTLAFCIEKGGGRGGAGDRRTAQALSNPTPSKKISRLNRT